MFHGVVNRDTKFNLSRLNGMLRKRPLQKGVISIFTIRLKNSILILLTALFASCQTDALLPCENEGPVGEICREYRYSDDAAIGYAEFEYETENSITENIYDHHSNLIKTIVEHFEDGKTVIIAEQYPDKESLVQSWHYNEIDSIHQIYFGGIDSLIEFTYENGKRLKDEYFHNGELDRWTSYRYYQDDGKLYRRSFYNAEDSLLRYENYQYFSTGLYRITYYTPSHQVTGRRVVGFSQLGLITSNEFTNALGVVTQNENYIYDVAGKLIERNGFNHSHSTKSVYLYY